MPQNRDFVQGCPNICTELKDYGIEVVVCLLEDGINALHKLSCAGDFEMFSVF